MDVRVWFDGWVVGLLAVADGFGAFAAAFGFRLFAVAGALAVCAAFSFGVDVPVGCASGAPDPDARDAEVSAELDVEGDDTADGVTVEPEADSVTGPL